MIDYKTIDLDNITYHTPRKNNGRYIGKVLYNNNNIKIKTPFLKCMNSINISENRCYMEFELDTNDKDLYDFFADLDDINMNKAYQNSEEWFGNQFPLDIVDEYYKRFIRYNSKLQRPYIKIRIPYDKNSGILMENFDNNDFNFENLMSLNLVHDGLRFFKQQFTSEWSLESYEVENSYIFKENIDELENTVYNDIKENSENNLETENSENNLETENSENILETENSENIFDNKSLIDESENILETENSENIFDNKSLIDESENIISKESKEAKKKSTKRIKGNIKPKIIRYAHRDRRWRY